MKSKVTIHRIRRFFLAAVLLLLCSFGNKAYATHLAAVDLSLKYIGTGPNDLTYEVTLVVYKACEKGAAGLAATQTVYYTSSCFTGGSIPISTSVGPDTLDQLCPNFAPDNACRKVDSPWPAFIRRIHRDTITLPGACTDWKFYWYQGNRNGGILNLDQPLNHWVYVEAGINNIAKYNNSTPRFTEEPIPYICVNQEAFFLNGALDFDNDSVATTNGTPLGWNTGTGAPLIIPFSAGYSASNPVPSPYYSVDPFTGTAHFFPTLQGKFVLAFKATDYDRTTGTQLSYVMRDVQVSVLDCAADPPMIDTIPKNMVGAAWVEDTMSKTYYIVACPDVPFSFEIGAESQSVSNSVFLSANNNVTIPGSGFSVVRQGEYNPTGTFTWTPGLADIGDYTLIITAKDSTCVGTQPIVLKSYFVVHIKVAAGIYGGPDGKVCKIDGVPYQMQASGPPGTEYLWTALDGSAAIGLDNPNIPNPKALPPNDFTYLLTGVNLKCKNKDTVVVRIDTDNSVIASPHHAVICRPGYFEINARGVGLPPLRNLMCGTTDTVAYTNPDTIAVGTVFGSGLETASSTFTPFPEYRTARTQFLLTQKDLRGFGVRSGTIRGLAFNVDQAVSGKYNNVTISLKCVDRNSLSSASGGMANDLTPVYTASGPVTITKGWNQFDFDTPYSIDSTKNLVVEICYSNLAKYNAGVKVMTVATSTETMVVNYTNLGNSSICTNPGIGTATNYFTGRPVIRINYSASDTLPFPFTWTPGTFLSDSTTSSPLAYVPKDITYIVSTVGRNGCKVIDSVVLKVPVHKYDVWPKDTSFCHGVSFGLGATGDFDKVKWYEVKDGSYNAATSLNCDDCANPIGKPLEDTRYAAVLTDVDGCSDTFFVKTVVKPNPPVQIINNDTTIKYGQSIQLAVTGAYLYSWQPVSTISNPNVINPIATPTEPTTYYVYGLGENQCRSVDSVRVNIDYRDNLFVPSAFSPNGDGKNDVFRVANITFQKLQEFRVFNRWGQEIYSTTDPEKGWDGSWKGVPQDMGSYQYLIRVAYPDGYIETYKGDVSLIR